MEYGIVVRYDIDKVDNTFLIIDINKNYNTVKTYPYKFIVKQIKFEYYVKEGTINE